MSNALSVSTAPAAKSGDIPSLDGLRAVAIAFVFISHLSPEIGAIVPGGFGVTVFFLLSGYLITTLLRQELNKYGSISFRNFYLRRALRLFPLLYLITAVATLLVWLGWIEGENSIAGILSILFYWGNYFVAIHHFDGIPNSMGVVWSLAIEEHFYFIWPLMFIWLARRKPSRRGWALALGLLCLVPLLLRLLLATQFGVDDLYLEHATETRFDSLLFGCVLALVFNPWLDPVPLARPKLELAIVVLALLVLAASLLYRDQLFRYTFRFTIQSLALMPLFWLAVARADWWLFKPLNWWPVRYIGQVSYAVYLVNLMIIFALAQHLPEWSVAIRSVIAVLATWAVAEVLRRYVEHPLGEVRKKLHRRTPQVS